MNTPSFDLAGKTALVTGAAQGLGEALAERFAAEGCHVVVTDLNEPGAQQVAERLSQDYSVQTLSGRMDVTCEDEVAAMMDTAVDRFGKLDIVVSNAGILICGPLHEFEVEEWRKVMEINLVGYMIVAKHAARVMLPQQSGVIIQINSKSGKTGSFQNSAYCASKFGGIAITQSLALELAEHGIRVNSVCPGNVLESPLWQEQLFPDYAKRLGMTEEQVRQRYINLVPMKRPCTYEDVANVVMFLASDAASYMTGQALNVTGGQQMD